MANEKRLIDANDAVKLLRGKCVAKYPNTFLLGILASASEVEQMPTVDAVEVVRCKDCKHREEEGECPMYYVKEIEWDDDGYTEVDYVPYDRTMDDGFCDRGERREGE